MESLPTLMNTGVTLVIGLPRPEPLLEMVARLALQGPVRVVVGGNRFDAHRLARLVRRQTLQIDVVLGRIQVARPFTAYQTVTLLQQSQGAAPLLVLDILDTFGDDSLSDQESIRLVTLAAAHLRRCGQQAPVLATVRLVTLAARQGLLPILEEAADRVLRYRPPIPPAQLSFW